MEIYKLIQTTVSAYTKSRWVLWWYSNGPSWDSHCRLWMLSSHRTSGRNQPSMEHTSGTQKWFTRLHSGINLESDGEQSSKMYHNDVYPILQLSYASGLAPLSDRTAFPGFYQNSPSFAATIESLHSMMNHFQWRRIALFTQDELIFTRVRCLINWCFPRAILYQLFVSISLWCQLVINKICWSFIMQNEQEYCSSPI